MLAGRISALRCISVFSIEWDSMCSNRLTIVTPVHQMYGTEDPRLAYDARSGIYFLFYTCYGKLGTIRSMNRDGVNVILIAVAGFVIYVGLGSTPRLLTSQATST